MEIHLLPHKYEVISSRMESSLLRMEEPNGMSPDPSRHLNCCTIPGLVTSKLSCYSQVFLQLATESILSRHSQREKQRRIHNYASSAGKLKHCGQQSYLKTTEGCSSLWKADKISVDYDNPLRMYLLQQYPLIQLFSWSICCAYVLDISYVIL